MYRYKSSSAIEDHFTDPNTQLATVVYLPTYNTRYTIAQIYLNTIIG